MAQSAVSKKKALGVHAWCLGDMVTVEAGKEASGRIRYTHSDSREFTPEFESDQLLQSRQLSRSWQPSRPVPSQDLNFPRWGSLVTLIMPWGWTIKNWRLVSRCICTEYTDLRSARKGSSEWHIRLDLLRMF